MTTMTTAHRLRASIAALLTAVVLGTGLIPASADELDERRDRTEAEQRAVDQALEDLEHELEHTDAALVEAYAELKGIEARITVAEEELAAAEALLQQLQLEAALIAERLEVAEAEEATINGQIQADVERGEGIRTAIGQMARDAYKGDLTSSSLSAVLDADSTDEFVEQSALAQTALRTQTQALRDLEQINGVNRNREARLAAVREQITELKAEADAKVVEADAARAAAEARTIELADLHAEQEAKAAEIEAQRQQQLAKQAEYAAQQAELAADLAEIIAEQEAQRKREAEAAAAAERRRQAAAQAAAEREAAEKGEPAPAPPPAVTPAPPAGSTSSRPFTNPTSIRPMYVTSDYGNRFHPILKYWRLHAGTDLRTYCGTPLYAGASGTVQWTRYRSGLGNQVMINHGYWKGSSLMSSYNHMSSFAVGAGQKVSQGQLIGYAGNTGTSAACHLHFEVYVNGSTVDPRPLIG